MKISVSGDNGEDVWVAIASKKTPIGRATQAAMKELSVIAKTRGRAAIAAGGFGKKWQDTLRSKDYKNSIINAAVLVYHKIPHAVAFEDGATIRGKTGKLHKLWIPLDTTPKRVGVNKISPALLQAKGVQMFAKKIGGKIFLMGNFGVTRANAKKARTKVTKGMLKRGLKGGGKRGVIKSIPLFVGVNTITLKKRFDVRGAVRAAGRDLPALYVKHFKDD